MATIESPVRTAGPGPAGYVFTMRHVAFLFAVLLSTAALANEAPRRVVSMNPCVDAILMRIADPQRIVAISHYSQDARATSVPLDWARTFPATTGTAEDVLARRPDLVIAGPHVALPTIHALKRLGIPLVLLPVASSIEQSAGQIRDLARLLDRAAEGEALAAEVAAAVAAATPADGRVIRALVWHAGGLVPGAGTLADDLLRQTGFENMSAAYGLRSWDLLSIEPLLANPPQVLLTEAGDASDDRRLSHPVLRLAAADLPIRAFPPPLLRCAGPTIIEAATRLAEIRRSLDADR